MRRLKIAGAAALAMLCAGTAVASEVSEAAARNKKALFVWQQEEPRNDAQKARRAGDLRVIEWLKSLGLAVETIDQAADPAGAKGKHLVIISESVDPVVLRERYRNVALPLVNFEPESLGDLGMTDQKLGRDYGTDNGQYYLWLVNAPHPLAGGIKAGINPVLNEPAGAMGWGKPGLGASIIATVRGDLNKATIFAYEKGATMNGDLLAPARRVSFFMPAASFEQLRPEGKALVRSALLWALAQPN